MSRSSKIAASVIPAFLLSKPLPLSTPVSRSLSICSFHRVGLSFSSCSASTTMPRDEGDVQYNWIDGAESLEKYNPGGYHPIMIGDMLHERYRIVGKLGFGGYSTVWLAQDTHLKSYVAVKVGIANWHPHETKVLQALSAPRPLSLSAHPGRHSIPLPLDEFELHGPNGTHPCYTMTPARCNLREVSFSRLFPLEVTRALSAGLALALSEL
ncbi:protein kinase [Histoplasma capsulatum G186AR]|nr:protein kinase [Histoplasma capsulatum]QSS75581.1 protein kinase [Histoplasma capsulatum G186AR]